MPLKPNSSIYSHRAEVQGGSNLLLKGGACSGGFVSPPPQPPRQIIATVVTSLTAIAVENRSNTVVITIPPFSGPPGIAMIEKRPAVVRGIPVP